MLNVWLNSESRLYQNQDHLAKASGVRYNHAAHRDVAQSG